MNISELNPQWIRYLKILKSCPYKMVGDFVRFIENFDAKMKISFSHTTAYSQTLSLHSSKRLLKFSDEGKLHLAMIEIVKKNERIVETQLSLEEDERKLNCSLTSQKQTINFQVSNSELLNSQLKFKEFVK